MWLQFVLTFLYMGFSKENDRFIIYFVIILLILCKKVEMYEKPVKSTQKIHKMRLTTTIMSNMANKKWYQESRQELKEN